MKVFEIYNESSQLKQSKELFWIEQ